MTVHQQGTWRAEAQEAALAAAEVESFRRCRQARWDASHIKTASCRLKVEEMEKLKEQCKRQGTTVYGLIRYMIAVYLRRRK